MKSAKAASGDASSSRRSQPVRQTRTNPPRVSSGLRGPANGRDSLAGGTASDQPIDIYPAITYFSDAIAALPKELVRHFTLLKEVDAKIFAPEDALFKLVDTAMNAPPPQPRPANDASSSVAPASAPMSAQNSSSGAPPGGPVPPAPSTDESYTTSIYDPSTYPRRQLFRQTAYKIQEMLGSLEEKNHVISTANDALQKQLARIDDVWPHVETEFSDEAKWGSTTHWAYPENRAATKAAHTERSRREGAAAISAAAQQLAEEAAARSESRKQAVQAKKSQKTAPQESDFDEAEGRGKAEPSKKGHGSSKARKAAEPAANVGLGISTNGTTNGAAPQPKRRKVEKTPSGNNATERAMSAVFGATASKAKTTSPRETPAPEGGPKKRKALPTGTGQAKKSKNGATGMSPSVASSPVMSTFPDPVLPRGSPAPTVTPVPPAPKPPTSSRAKQSTTQAAVEGGKQSRPPSSASAKPNGIVPLPIPEVAPSATLPKPTVETKPVVEESSVPPALELPKQEPEPIEMIAKPSIPAAKQKKETPKPEEIETPVEPPPVHQTITAATVTKSGRASKPSTPAMATFQEAARPKSARNTDSNNTSKRKKSNAVTAGKAAKTADQTEDSEDIEEAEIHASKRYDYTEDEPTYCYCTSVSYGEMVACDANNCEREWFHLNCVGLKVAPKGSSKWYCEECLQRLSKQGKKLSKYNVLPDSLNMRKQRAPPY
ncbi:PHD-finger domain-containing protein [Colletotrichum higginsianum]|uniref:Chromatin modification-related protein n=2 Tax=Colletotrichum higginsianum TaxID=80884 RepID=H1VJT3_COLHI|nr:Chromatin modification-related protein [Colletotrichum higginsianum IMI 349063]OBR03796.1 Chromatin modification-related protein [Colletotrichum higginsianum IMI 349063]TIC97171.1 Chromatin modification-related protein png1 [Colletotrichum higginsianum]CCF40486.1 PHD-finger domain-containing protein [Colletotrichum higginsianum]